MVQDFRLWHHVDAQTVSDFEEFQISDIQIKNTQPVYTTRGLRCLSNDKHFSNSLYRHPPETPAIATHTWSSIHHFLLGFWVLKPRATLSTTFPT